LLGKKLVAAEGGQRAALPALVAGAEALRRVLDHRQAVARGDGVDLVHVGHLAVQAHRHDGPGARRDLRLDQAGVDVAGVGLDVDEHRLAPSSTIISAVAAKVKGVVMTSSPGFRSSAISAISSASVPLATVMQCRRR
jgi:hypothetical protein